MFGFLKSRYERNNSNNAASSNGEICGGSERGTGEGGEGISRKVGEGAPSAVVPSNDCFECRVIGTVSLGAISGYLYRESTLVKEASKVKDRRFLLVLSGGFAVASVVRFLA